MGTEMGDDRVLTEVDAISLFIIINMRGKRVARALPNGHTLYGIARGIGDVNGGVVRGLDIRDAFLRVTDRSGFEHFWQVSGLVRLVQNGEFVEYDWE